MSFDHVLVIGFGGPTQPGEIKPFLQEVTRDRNIPERRLQEVSHHYDLVGGYSPYNAYTFQLADKLKETLSRSEIKLPLFVGMRNWHPFLKETLTEITRQGLRKGIGIILAPHRSETSFERYVQNVEEAKSFARAHEIRYEYLDSWYDHPLFIQAQAEEVEKILCNLNSEERRNTHLLFSAHSIPEEMARQCRYADEFRRSSELVARELKHAKWSLAYQSRSGDPRQPWLGPDVISSIRDLAKQNEQAVLVVPVGFLCDNVEVLYDLDIEARSEAKKVGIRYLRSRTVTDHAKFVEMFGLLIKNKLVRPAALV